MSNVLTLIYLDGIRRIKGVDMSNKIIENLKGCPYEQILKTSKEIDELLVEYYLEETKDIT